MQYLCSQCRRPLQLGQTMCQCGQLFSRVPIFDSNDSTLWPPAADLRPAALQWFDGISPAVKASVAGGAVLVMAVIVIAGPVRQYQALHARYAPGAPVQTASAVPVHAPMLPATPSAPSMPVPIVLRAAPRYVPPMGNGASSFPSPNQGPSQQGSQYQDQSPDMKPTSGQAAAASQYAAAENDADHWKDSLEQEYGPGLENLQTFSQGELGRTSFGPTVKYNIAQGVLKMRQDLDVMQQNFSSMSAAAQGMADPSVVGIPSGPLTGVSAKESIQAAIDKWTPYCQQ